MNCFFELRQAHFWALERLVVLDQIWTHLACQGANTYTVRNNGENQGSSPQQSEANNDITKSHIAGVSIISFERVDG